jgi:hypothetical protein
MHKSSEHRLGQSRVTALFENRAISFVLAKGATLCELSDQLACLARSHDWKAVAITLKVGSSSRKTDTCGTEGVRQDAINPAPVSHPRHLHN